MKRRIVFSIACFATTAALCQEPTQKVESWLRTRAKAAEKMSNAVARMAIANNDTALTRQRESVSGDDRSTSLVDQSSASNFFSIAATFLPVTAPAAGGGSASPGSGSATVSLYSIAAALTRTSLTDPAFYKEHTWARNWSLTLGRSTSKLADDNTDKPGTVFGVKLALINDRDIYSKRNEAKLKDVQDKLSTQTDAFNRLAAYVENVIFVACGVPLSCDTTKLIEDPAAARLAAVSNAAAFVEFEKKLGERIDSLQFPPELLELIDRKIPAFLERDVDLQTAINDTYDAIHKGRQLAVAYQITARPDNGNDDHRAELIFDWGFDKRLNWTVNASGDYKDRKMGRDSRGGRIATEFQTRLTNPLTSTFSRFPLTLAFSGEAKWMTLMKPKYSAQAKFTIPVSAGIDLPVTYRWTSRHDATDTNDNEVRFGFSIDLGRLAKSLGTQVGGAAK